MAHFIFVMRSTKLPLLFFPASICPALPWRAHFGASRADARGRVSFLPRRFTPLMYRTQGRIVQPQQYNNHSHKRYTRLKIVWAAPHGMF